jgi:glycerol-3-phosphate acyltransferase PlsX
LLGAKQLTVICHGSSSPKAIRNAIRIAKEFYKGKLNESIEAELSKVAVANL